MGSRSLLTTAVLATALWAAAPSAAIAVPPTCQDILANNRYTCRVKSETGFEGTLCFQFVSPDAVGKIDLQPTSFFATTLTCMCEASGSYRNPRFNTSKSFLCGNPEFGDAAKAKVTGNGRKILQGQYYFSGSPQAHIFECDLDPTCVDAPLADAAERQDGE